MHVMEDAHSYPCGSLWSARLPRECERVHIVSVPSLFGRPCRPPVAHSVSQHVADQQINARLHLQTRISGTSRWLQLWKQVHFKDDIAAEDNSSTPVRPSRSKHVALPSHLLWLPKTIE